MTILWLAALLTVLAAGGATGTGTGTDTDSTGAQTSTAASAASDADASTAASTAGGASASTAASTAGSVSASAGGAATGNLPDLGGRAILIGTGSTYPPFESLDPQTNEIVGFDVDLMAEIARLINLKPEFQTTSFETIFEALAAKQFDAVMSAVTITEERKQKVDFSDPYVSIGQQVVALKTNDQIKRYEDLKTNNFQVGVQRGTTGEQAALTKAGVPEANVKRYDDIAAAFSDLNNNAIDAIVADGPTVANYTSQEQYRDKMAVVGEAFTTEDYGIAVQKGDTELLNAINAVLAQLQQSGKIDELKQKYEIKE